ncbi:MAG: dihydroxyacetone kinase subunit DhaK [Eubacteriales bacterium]|jgi:dihydroxyacetone kinase-like protein|nr:dihydroxyacetone kinase subunit DhaK [Eubacteriales bacterium]MDD3289534.1 dihydroxyacetone kinase subunit DhaK [Eubacteriales bacterium]MDD3863199.1 dihydroxyacetone kinase subunit DhaK [Eubacteriales bacterium]MDD4444660.1 dihydroxyacetone kinase subunit DhaK [Eubacteriales bacterium]
MKKIMNLPENFVDETMEGIVLAYGEKVGFLNGDRRILISKAPVCEGKVGIVTAGGSGHLPVFLGYVGSGMLDGCAIGNVFASPSAQKMEDMIRACDRGNGVLCLYGNYGGDRLNFDMACEAADFDDIATRTVLVTDDVASSPKGDEGKRRGVAGMVYAFKIAGAAAALGKSLDEVANITQRALDQIRTMGIALSPCIVPEVGKPTFHIEADEMEVGMGIHGEPGIQVEKLKSADESAQLILETIDRDMPLAAGDEVSVMVNGLGATPMEELLIVYRKIHQTLEAKNVSVFMPHIGEFATSMEMAGLSVTVFKLDKEFKELLRYPAATPFYTNANK